MPLHRLPLPPIAALRLVLGLMLLLALPAIAQVAALRPVALPKPVERIAAQPRIPVTVTTARSEAETIALASPSLREAARRLKLRGLPAPVSLAAVRSVFRASERDNYQSLLAAGYAKPELLDAIKQIDRPDAAGMRARLADLGEGTRESALQLVRLYPGFTFDGLFALIRTHASTDDAFAASVAALALGVDQIASTGARFHQSRQFATGHDRFFPEAETVAALIRASHPATPHAVIWSRLLAVGYSPEMVFAQVGVGDFERNGRAVDAVAGCIAQRFPNRRPGANPTVDIAIALDGRASHDPRQADCYATFLQSLRGQSVPSTVAAQLAESFVACVPAQAPTCPAERPAVVRSILDGAGFPPERR